MKTKRKSKIFKILNFLKNIFWQNQNYENPRCHFVVSSILYRLKKETCKSVKNSSVSETSNFVCFSVKLPRTWPRFDLNNSWPNVTYDLIFGMKVSNWCPVRYAKFGGAARRRFWPFQKNRRGSPLAPPPTGRGLMILTFGAPRWRERLGEVVCTA